MALIKTISLDSGVQGNYLKINKIFLNLLKKSLTVEVSLYLDKQSRLENKDAVLSFYYDIENCDLITLDWLNTKDNNIVKLCYVKLKELYYTDAVDD